MDAYKAQTAGFSLIRKQYEKCKALEDEIKSLPTGEEEKKRARLQTVFAKQTAEFYKIADVKYEKISNKPLPRLPLSGEEPVFPPVRGGLKARRAPSPDKGRAGEGFASLQDFFDTRLKEAVIAYGADPSQTGGLSLPLREHLDGEREYNLSFDKYAGGSDSVANSQHEMVKLGEVCAFEYGKPLKEEDRVIGDYPVYGSNGIVGYHNNFLVEAPFIVIGRKGSAGSVHFSERNGFPIDTTFFVKLENENRILLKYLYNVLQQLNLKDLNTQAGVPGLNRNDAYQLEIPLPSLEFQKQIVAEIEAYQKVIDGCNLIIENYKQDIQFSPEWPLVGLGTIATMSSGGTPSKAEAKFWNGDIPWVSPKDMKVDFIEDTEDHISIEAVSSSATRLVSTNTLLCVVRSGILQHTFPIAITLREMCFNQDIIAITAIDSRLDIRYLFNIFKAKNQEILQTGIKPGVTVQSFHSGFFKTYQIPLPPLETQQKIVTELEEDLTAVSGARRLKAKMEANIRAAIGRVWGESMSKDQTDCEFTKKLV